jgi:hypothetical protein
VVAREARPAGGTRRAQAAGTGPAHRRRRGHRARGWRHVARGRDGRPDEAIRRGARRLRQAPLRDARAGAGRDRRRREAERRKLSQGHAFQGGHQRPDRQGQSGRGPEGADGEARVHQGVRGRLPEAVRRAVSQVLSERRSARCKARCAVGRAHAWRRPLVSGLRPRQRHALAAALPRRLFLHAGQRPALHGRRSGPGQHADRQRPDTGRVPAGGGAAAVAVHPGQGQPLAGQRAKERAGQPARGGPAHQGPEPGGARPAQEGRRAGRPDADFRRPVRVGAGQRVGEQARRPAGGQSSGSHAAATGRRDRARL